MLADAAIAHTSGLFGTACGDPGHPWGTPWLAFCDTIRCLLFLALGWNIVVVVRARIKGLVTTSRLLAVAGFCWAVGETGGDRLGHGIGAGGRLWISIIAFVAVTVELWPIGPLARGPKE